MKIIVVGNGSCSNKNGKRIDSFDYVVRMGSCCLKGYEEYVGTRTDMLRSSWDRLLRVEKCGKIHFVNKICNYKDFLFLEPHYDPYRETSLHGGLPHLYKIFNKPRFLKKRFKTVINERIMHEQYVHQYLPTKNIFYYSINDRINLFSTYNNLHNDKTLHMPSAGLFTIDYIIKTFTNSEIFITGFDGFKTRYYWRQNDEYFDSHSSIKEQLYIKKLINSGDIKKL